MITTVEEIRDQALIYRQLGTMFIVIAIIFAIMTVILWFVLKIKHSIQITTGIGAGRELEKIKRNSTRGNEYIGIGKAVLSWNTSGLLTHEMKDEGQEETTVLEDSGLYGSEETTVLDVVNEGFIIEEDIKLTGTDKTI